MRHLRDHLPLLLLGKTTLRHWREGWLSYLTLLGIVAVGVGALNGIRQASRAAAANFGLFNEAISGRSDFLIEAPMGMLEVSALQGLGAMAMDPDWHLLPVVEGSVAHLDDVGEAQRQLRVVGLDLIAVGNLPNFIEQGLAFAGETDESDAWYDWVGAEAGVWLSGRLAETAGLQRGSRLRYALGGRIGELPVAGVLRSSTVELPEDLVICDMPVAQALLGKAGQLDRIEVILANRATRAESDTVAAMEQRLRAVLPDGLVLSPSEDRAEQRASMTQAFRLNLTILSLIAILVGAYLILQALDGAVVRRRAEMATLRSLGVGARTLFSLCLLEALLIGVLGSVGGVGVGVVLAGGAVHLLAETVNALYFATSIEAIELTRADWLLGVGLGVVFSLLAGLIPARDAMQTPPAQVLARGDWSPGFRWLHRPVIGYVLVLMGCVCLWLPPQRLSGGGQFSIGGFTAAGCWIFGAALLSGQVLTWLAGLCRRRVDGPVVRLALSRLADGSSRHRLAVAGLVVAVGMVVGMLQMVGSFRDTIERWFDVRFQAELYVSERGVSGAGAVHGIDAELITELTQTEGIRFADTVYFEEVGGPVGTTHLLGADFEAWTGLRHQLWYLEPGQLVAVPGAEPALISETFARRFDLLQGGVVALQTPTGSRSVSPIGIFADYGNEFGTAVIDQATWQAWTGTDRALNMSLFLNPGVDPHALREQLRLQYPGLDIRNATELRTLALGIFDQTFRVTTALNGIGLSVALVGLLLGLLAIFQESTRTWATLDCLGFTRRRLIRAAGVEGAGIALVAWLSGTMLGVALGWLLIAVVNVQSFGWTLQWSLPWGQFVLFGLLLSGLGYLCGAVCARVGAKRGSGDFDT
jgi:putative ABC transport system permease protein